MRYIKDGFDPIETSLPSEGVQLRAEGWRTQETEASAPEPVEEVADEATEPVFDNGGVLEEGLNEVRNDLGRPETLVRPKRHRNTK